MKSDTQLQQDVESSLNLDGRIDDERLRVRVSGGTVTLTGSVPSSAMRVAAEQAAHRVSGVLDVANAIHVHLPGALDRSDTAIAQAVRFALECNVDVPDADIHSTVTDGWVTLEGTAGTWYQREAAERAIQQLPGVRGVVTKIAVHFPLAQMMALD